MSYSISPNNKLLNTTKWAYLLLSFLGGIFFIVGGLGFVESLKNGWEYNPIVNVFLLIWMLFSSAIFLIGVKMFLFEPKNVSIQVTEEK